MAKQFNLFFATVIFTLIITTVSAQGIPGPGAERDMKRINELRKGSVLRKDTIELVERISVVDPETGDEVQQVIINAYSIYDYCRLLLGINNPDALLDGQPMEITDPSTYEKMTIRWNAEASRIDTLPR